jgi:hypothetical protein
MNSRSLQIASFQNPTVLKHPSRPDLKTPLWNADWTSPETSCIHIMMKIFCLVKLQCYKIYSLHVLRIHTGHPNKDGTVGNKRCRNITHNHITSIYIYIYTDLQREGRNLGLEEVTMVFKCWALRSADCCCLPKNDWNRASLSLYIYVYICLYHTNKYMWTYTFINIHT